MKVAFDPLQNPIAGGATSAPTPATRVVRQPAPAPATDSAVKQAAVPAELLQPNVTFRKDSAGKIYYIVTDAQSGKEIREVPADAVRKAGEGIDEFLKQLEAKQNSHLEVKA
jgi:uncharacterized FlaG/YvyC family protein